MGVEVAREVIPDQHRRRQDQPVSRHDREIGVVEFAGKHHAILEARLGKDHFSVADAPVDALNHQIFRELLTFMMEDARTIPRAIRLILISRFLERLADHATNIAEMVIYLVDAKMVRHTLA